MKKLFKIKIKFNGFDKKLFKVILSMAIILSNFSPLLSVKVKAASNYTVAIAYSDRDVEQGAYDTYTAAFNAMNAITSTELAVAVIKNINGKIINAKYAIAETDYTDGIKRNISVNDEGVKYLCSLPNQAATCNPSSSSYITYYASTWGTDAALLDYNSTYDAMKIKISGVTGWLPIGDVNIVPISKYYGTYNTANYSNNYPKVKAIVSGVRLRESPSESAAIKATITEGAIYTYYPSYTTTANGYTWYKIQYNDSTTGYVADNGTYFQQINTMKNDTYYYSYQNVLYHQVHAGAMRNESSYKLGTAPFYYNASNALTPYMELSSSTELLANKRYYSFDGNYFYISFSKMLDDYKACDTNSNNCKYTNAMNSLKPYYSYFMYLPSRAKSGYVASQINQFVINAGKTGYPTNPKSYVNTTTGTVSGLGSLSIMYGIGQTIINASNTYGVNPLTIYSAAASESGTGTSAISLYKNNLFGMGAVDGDDTFNKAYTYTTLADSVNAYAAEMSISSYATLTSKYYSGTHLGNKSSGQAVFYASDPYSGESKSATAYQNDLVSGQIDNFSNTLGITTNLTAPVKIYSEPLSTSTVIYETKNYSTGKTLTNMPFIVTDKISVIESGQSVIYYKVYTDVTLTPSRVVSYSDFDYYNFGYCYGYIKESDLYVANNQPKIEASNRTVTQHDSVDLLANVTATDTEDGNLTSSVTVSNTGSFDVEKPGSYTITYTVMDKSKYSVSKDITITVKPSGIPTIVAPDITIPQYKSFDPKTGVTVEDIDAADKDLINKLTVTGTVDVSTIGDYILTYMVTDAAGSTTTETRKVTVVANEKPVINATNLTVYKGQTFNYSNGVTATDKEDGNVTSSLTYTGTVDMTTNGTYEVTYSATDLDNQTSSKIVTITVEDKIYRTAASMFYLSNLTYNTNTKKVDFTGYLTIKGMNNTAATNIAYDIIFENQNNGNTIIKPLSRLTSNVPFAVPNSGGFDYSGSWFKESLDLSDLVSGDYTVYVRARSGDYEAKVLLKNEYFNTNVARKFTIDSVGYQFRINYYNRALPLELFVRSSGLVSSVNNPTIDNMYNQVYSIKLEGTTFKLQASSHNVKGNYASSQTIERYVMFENIDTLEIAKTVNVGAITNGPYRVNLKVSDGYDKTKVWYNTNIDLSDLPKGTYSVIVRTKAGAIDDYGELYDVLYKNDINQSQTIGDKKITITRHNELRYRIEITVE